MNQQTLTPVSKPKLVVIGNGIAGARCIDELLKLCPDKYDITIIGEEPQVNYNRIMLSPVLAGEKQLQDIVINDLDWYRQHRINLVTGDPVIAIHRGRKTVVTAGDRSFAYDKLIIATGSRPNIIPFPGHDLKHVMGFRTMADVNHMLSISRSHQRAVVIGGGLLGLEAANGLRQQGMAVTVIHNSDFLLNRQLDPRAAELLQQALERKQVTFRLAARTESLEGNSEHRVTHVRLTDGTRIPADLVVFATGVKPNKELAERAGIYCENGIVVNDTLQTFDPSVYAVGECVQHRGELFGLVAPLFQQARVCANQLAEWGCQRYQTTPMATQLKVTGIDVYSAGDFMGDETTDLLTYYDRDQAIYKKLVIKNQQLKGVVLYGDISDGAFYFDLVQNGTNIEAIRDLLIFGRQLCLRDTDPEPAFEAA
ncbi:MAG: FAD-dependent oxidoreductase [Ketobacteraceae bacterium]|nr:FAD-dependent oxidoreductase [Ketobacteraceae bacterium]